MTLIGTDERGEFVWKGRRVSTLPTHELGDILRELLHQLKEEEVTYGSRPVPYHRGLRQHLKDCIDSIRAEIARRNAEVRHPLQPTVIDDSGVVRFKENAIINYMFEMGRRGKSFDLNTLAVLDFSDEDRRQLSQLTGYSICGYCDIHESESYEVALAMHEQECDERNARITVLENKLQAIKRVVAKVMGTVFDDYEELEKFEESEDA